jgi:hypothetical protein
VRRHIALAAVSAVLFSAPRAAQALITLEGYYGLARPPSVDFHSAVSGATNDSHLWSDSLNIAGGDLILHLGLLELGAIGDVTWKSGSASQTAIGALGGVGFDLGGFRLEALGEAGGHRIGNFTENPSIVTSSSTSQWLAYLGLRPGIAYRFGEKSGFILGLWGYARWDVTSKNVPVTVASAGGTAPGELKLGGTTVGATVRLGYDF